jgi:hypothetical protein
MIYDRSSIDWRRRVEHLFLSFVSYFSSSFRRLIITQAKNFSFLAALFFSPSPPFACSIAKTFFYIRFWILSSYYYSWFDIKQVLFSWESKKRSRICLVKIISSFNIKNVFLSDLKAFIIRSFALTKTTFVSKWHLLLVRYFIVKTFEKKTYKNNMT